MNDIKIKSSKPLYYIFLLRAKKLRASNENTMILNKHKMILNSEFLLKTDCRPLCSQEKRSKNESKCYLCINTKG